LTNLTGHDPIACMWVFTMSTRNMAKCSTVLAIEPAIMNCQKCRLSWANMADFRWKSSGCGIGQNFGFWNLAVAFVAMEIYGFGRIGCGNGIRGLMGFLWKD
jgi:hypothetical protein